MSHLSLIECPDYILLEIAKYLDNVDLYHMSLTSNRFKHIMRYFAIKLLKQSNITSYYNDIDDNLRWLYLINITTRKRYIDHKIQHNKFILQDVIKLNDVAIYTRLYNTHKQYQYIDTSILTILYWCKLYSFDITKHIFGKTHILLCGADMRQVFKNDNIYENIRNVQFEYKQNIWTELMNLNYCYMIIEFSGIDNYYLMYVFDSDGNHLATNIGIPYDNYMEIDIEIGNELNPQSVYNNLSMMFYNLYNHDGVLTLYEGSAVYTIPYECTISWSAIWTLDNIDISHLIHCVQQDKHGNMYFMTLDKEYLYSFKLLKPGVVDSYRSMKINGLCKFSLPMFHRDNDNMVRKYNKDGVYLFISTSRIICHTATNLIKKIWIVVCNNRTGDELQLDMILPSHLTYKQKLDNSIEINGTSSPDDYNDILKHLKFKTTSCIIYPRIINTYITNDDDIYCEVPIHTCVYF